jgi:tetraacyldisaccharide 4'-kinase
MADRAASLLHESTPLVPPGFWSRLLLTVPAALWSLTARLRRKAYATGLLGSKPLPRFTLCIGNLTAGGTGKTPTTIRLVEDLGLRAQSLAILTRGYGRTSKQPSILVMPGDICDPAEVGDEPALLADRLFCPIGVGADRAAVASELLERAPVDIFVLDDGYQRLSVERNFNLALIDVTRPFETDACLPLGRLREPLDGLARADAILLTRTRPGLRYEAFIAKLRGYNSGAPVFLSRTRPASLIEMRFRREIPLDKLSGKRAFTFSGIGNPDAFVRSLEDLGIEVIDNLAFPDHHRYTLDDWWQIAAAARDSGADVTITTQKDLVNLSAKAPQEMRTGAPPLHVLDIDLEIDDSDRLYTLIEQRLEAYAQ